MCKHENIALLAGFVLALASCFPDSSQAQSGQRAAVLDSSSKAIGKVVVASGSVSIERAGAMVVQASTAGQDIRVGDPVYQGDVVKTGADGRIGINFADGSSFNLSSNARMALDEFVYDPNSRSNSTLFNLTNGTMTFVAGTIAKSGDMKVDTPVATMGIRGTTPHIEVSEDGAVKFSTLIEAGKDKVSRRPAAERQQTDYLKNAESCNSKNTVSPEARIEGCTALIQTVQGNATALPIAYNNRGNAYVAKGDYDRAVRDFDQSIKLNQTYTKPFNNRGVAYLRKGEYDLAIGAFDEAIRLKPDYGEAFANRATAHLKQREYDRAARDFDQAIRIDPGLRAAWSGRCWSRAVLGALQAALEDCDKALQADPDSALTHDSRGLIHLKMGQLDAAITDFNSALRLDPKLASALYGRGFARLRTGGMADGNDDMALARSIDADVADKFVQYGIR
jgi:tetratricopeptide (TPR) repeat protein